MKEMRLALHFGPYSRGRTGRRVTRVETPSRARAACGGGPGGAGSGRDDRERRVAIVEQAQQLPQLRPFTLHDDCATGEELGGILLA